MRVGPKKLRLPLRWDPSVLWQVRSPASASYRR